MQIVPVIMAGGSGTRLWPLSRAMYPKQFLPLVSRRSMLQETVARVEGLDAEQGIFLCNADHRFLVAEQLREAGYRGARIILEPVARNTAPAVALAALDLVDRRGDGTMLVMAADHVIGDLDAFHEAVRRAARLAEQGRLVTFGIVPTHAETGYGYIETGDADGDGFAVSRFVEKPDEAAAAEYLAAGNFLWNSGMFVIRASDYIDELQRFRPDILAACRAALDAARPDIDFLRIGVDEFSACPSDSIDYAVMEHTDRAAVVPLDAGWNDIGSWSALWEVDEKTDHGNAYLGDVLLHDTRNSLVHATSRLVAAVGLEDVIIVETKDAVMVSHKNAVQDIKEVVGRLKERDRPEYLHHRDVYRPWGHYDCIDGGERYQVKRIRVKPGAKLSVQMHHHRADHWIVVSGSARVTVDERTFLVTENESTYIPIGAVHSLENPGKVDLDLIEVQSGAYLGEDDIVRLEDLYGREGT